VLTLRLLPAARGPAAGGRLDVAGAVTVTASLMLAVYAIVNGNDTGWTSGQTLGLLGGGVVLLAAFLAIGFFPILFRILPRPGPWVEAFERIMGFILIATVVWLVDTIGSLTGKAGVTGMLAFLTAVSLGAWIYGHWGGEVASLRARLVSLGIAVVLAVVGGRMFLVTEIAPATEGAAVFRMEGLDYARRIPWQSFSDENVSALRKARKPGFIDFTADW